MTAERSPQPPSSTKRISSPRVAVPSESMASTRKSRSTVSKAVALLHVENTSSGEGKPTSSTSVGSRVLPCTRSPHSKVSRSAKAALVGAHVGTSVGGEAVGEAVGTVVRAEDVVGSDVGVSVAGGDVDGDELGSAIAGAPDVGRGVGEEGVIVGGAVVGAGVIGGCIVGLCGN
eukprot:scaffold923_cov256-Pinguiococcus_pyrenoidosus.AAC.27